MSVSKSVNWRSSAPDVGWAKEEWAKSLYLPLVASLLRFHRYVRWVSIGSGEICPFSNSKSLLSTTFPVFKPKKWFCTFSKAMAIEKMNMCVDRCLIIIVIFVFSGSLPAVLLNLEKAAVTLVVISTIRDSFHM
jgi:hypothetical protein